METNRLSHQTISALVDGELDEHQICNENDKYINDFIVWQMYSQIGDAIRSNEKPPRINQNACASIFYAINKEPSYQLSLFSKILTSSNSIFYDLKSFSNNYRLVSGISTFILLLGLLSIPFTLQNPEQLRTNSSLALNANSLAIVPIKTQLPWVTTSNLSTTFSSDNFIKDQIIRDPLIDQHLFLNKYTSLPDDKGLVTIDNINK